MENLGKVLEVSTKDGQVYTGVLSNIDVYLCCLGLSNAKNLRSRVKFDYLIFRATDITNLHLPEDPAIIYKGRKLK